MITGGGTGLTYQPNPNYCNDPPGTTLDTFTYTLTPGGSTATVSVTVTCVDDPPVAVNDTATVVEDAAGHGDRRVGQRHRRRRRPDDDRLGDPAGQRHRGDHRRRHRAHLSARTPTTATPRRAPPSTRSPTRSPRAAPPPPCRSPSPVSTTHRWRSTTPPTVLEDAAADGDRRAGQRHRRRRRPDVDRRGDASGQRHRGDHRWRDRAHLPAERQLLQQPARHHPRHVHLHPHTGGSTATVSVTVTCVNDPPVAGDDSFTGARSATPCWSSTTPTDAGTDGRRAEQHDHR